MNREHHQDDGQEDITVPNPTEAQHNGEITCKGYGPPPEDENGDEDPSSGNETR